MRPGCDRPAAARLAFDPIALQLWVDPLGPRSAPVQELCEFHIERLTIPRGWSATDRRPGPSVVGIARSPVGAMARTAVPVVEHPVRDTAPEPEPEPIVLDLEPEPTAPEPEPIVLDLEPEPVVLEPEPVTPEPEPVALEPVALEPVALEPEPEPAPSERPARGPRRGRSTREELPLLSRAFAWTGPQQSILTQRAEPGADPDDAPGADGS